jgi:hypothetical protein
MIIHRKRIGTTRPDDADATHVRGINNWDAAHVAPDQLAYMITMPAPIQMAIPSPNQPDTELPNLRSKYDFTYVDKVRLIVGCDFGTAKISMLYSSDQITWTSFDGAGGPFITQVQANGQKTTYASPWITIAAIAKADRFIAPFYRDNRDTTIVQVSGLWLYVR